MVFINMYFVVLLATISLISYPTSSFGDSSKDDWKVNFEFGKEFSTYNTEDAVEDKVFEDGAYIELSSSQYINNDSTTKCGTTFAESLRLGASNVETAKDSTGAKQVEVSDAIITDISIRRDYPLSNTSCDGIVRYYRAGTGFIFERSEETTSGSTTNLYVVAGLRNKFDDSDYLESFVEFGAGMDKRFIHEGRMIVNAGVTYKFTDKNDWVLSMKVQSSKGQGDDDFRFLMGLKRNFDFFAETVKTLLGVTADKKGDATP